MRDFLLQVVRDSLNKGLHRFLDVKQSLATWIWRSHWRTVSFSYFCCFLRRPLIKILLLQNVSHLVQGVENWFLKREMKLSKKEMEFFIPFPGLLSKKFFCKMFLIWSKGLKINFQNRKWNYSNRKWNYFSNFQASDQKTPLQNVSHLIQGAQH